MVDFHKDKSLSLTTMGENSWPSTFCFLKGTVTTTMWAHAMYGEQCSLSDSRNPVYVYKEGDATRGGVLQSCSSYNLEDSGESVDHLPDSLAVVNFRECLWWLAIETTKWSVQERGSE